VFREVSAKDEIGVEELFLQLTKLFVEKHKTKQLPKSGHGKSIAVTPEKDEKCCH
jgi:hypothetical protein